MVDNLGRPFLRFTQFRFEIVSSDLLDPARHRVAVNFYAEPLLWHDTVGPYLLASEPGAAPGAPGETLVHTFQLQPYLAVHALRPAENLPAS